MAFPELIKNMFDTRMFTDSTYISTQNSETGPYKITITPNAVRTGQTKILQIVGIIKEGINISMNAEYDTLNLGSIVSNFPKIQTLYNYVVAPMAAMGKSINNSGLITEKFYVRGGYLDLDPSFRVVNWRGDGQPLISAVILLCCCVPAREEDAFNLQSIFDWVVERTKPTIDKIESFTESIVNALGGDYEGTKESFMAGIENFKNKYPTISRTFDEGKNKIMKESFQLTSAPTSVTVDIANYFHYDEMVIENVSVDFSPQMTETGPLYADFKIKLSSKTMPTVSTMGASLSKKRVTETNEINKFSDTDQTFSNFS